MIANRKKFLSQVGRGLVGLSLASGILPSTAYATDYVDSNKIEINKESLKPGVVAYGSQDNWKELYFVDEQDIAKKVFIAQGGEKLDKGSGAYFQLIEKSIKIVQKETEKYFKGSGELVFRIESVEKLVKNNGITKEDIFTTLPREYETKTLDSIMDERDISDKVFEDLNNAIENGKLKDYLNTK